MVPKGCSEAVVQGEIWSVAYITRMCLFRARGGGGEMFFLDFWMGLAAGLLCFPGETLRPPFD